MAVRGELRATRQAARHVLHKPRRILGVAPAHEPGHDQLAIRVQRRPRPSVTGLFRRSLSGRNVLLLGVGETPNLVALHALGADVPHRLVMESLTGPAGVNEQLRHRIQADAGDPADGAQAAALAEQGEDSGSLVGREFVHGGSNTPSCLIDQA